MTELTDDSTTVTAPDPLSDLGPDLIVEHLRIQCLFEVSNAQIYGQFSETSVAYAAIERGIFAQLSAFSQEVRDAAIAKLRQELSLDGFNLNYCYSDSPKDATWVATVMPEDQHWQSPGRQQSFHYFEVSLRKSSGLEPIARRVLPVPELRERASTLKESDAEWQSFVKNVMKLLNKRLNDGDSQIYLATYNYLNVQLPRKLWQRLHRLEKRMCLSAEDLLRPVNEVLSAKFLSVTHSPLCFGESSFKRRHAHSPFWDARYEKLTITMISNPSEIA